MSIEVELNGKAGRVCQEAIDGIKRCPLIVRTTSEDVLVGNVFGLLKHIRPHLWLNQILNLALFGGIRGERFRQVWFRNLRIRFWQRQDRYPRELLNFREGRTEPDIIIEWDNPSTSIWIEAKYNAKLADGTSNNPANSQVLRGIRTLLAATGHIKPRRLFNIAKRRAIWLALLAYEYEPLVEQYRDSAKLLADIPNSEYVDTLPECPFVGTVSWPMIRDVVRQSCRQMTMAERSMAAILCEYIDERQAASCILSPEIPQKP